MFKSFKALFAAAILLFMGYQQTDACTNVIITKGASKDGSVMVTYAADSHQLFGELYYTPAGTFPDGTMMDVTEWDTGKFLGKIAQINRTYQTVGNMNERQLMITETTFGGRPELYDPAGIMDYGSLIYITLQRARTAREAIGIIDGLMQEYGYASSGESFTIADKNEAWIMEIIGKGSKVENGVNVRKGAVWVATRIPDGYISAHANQARITKIDFKDKENWLYAKDVVSFAREMGYFEGKDEDFSFCDAYAPLDFGAMRGCEARVWSAFNILGKGMIGDKKAEEYLDYAMGYNKDNRLPLYFKPAEKVGLKEVADVMRDHYEGSPMDMTTDAGAGACRTPYRWRPMSFEYEGETYTNERAIATQQTGFWILCQARNWLPDEVGGILWFGTDDAATSPLTPVYTSITEVPECIRVGNGSIINYSPTSMFWATNRIAQFAYLFYDRVFPEVDKVIDAHENAAIEAVKQIDAKAMELYGENVPPVETEWVKVKGRKAQKAELAKKYLTPNPDVRKVLTDYSVTTAQNLFRTWQELDIYLLTKFLDGNVKVQNPDGTFKNNGHSHRIPASPTNPQFPEAYKKAIVDTNGDVLRQPKEEK